MSDVQDFQKSRRLLNAKAYQAVFDHVDYKASSRVMLCLAYKNGLAHPRLGLVIAKKNVKHAVQRNRIKRIIRESFRLHQQQLPDVDMIFLARRGLDALENEQLHKEMTKIWQRLANKASSHQHDSNKI